MRTYFTTLEVARILNLSSLCLRSCLQAALYPTARGASTEFTFQDLLLLKTTKGLLDARVPVARVRKILHSLKRQLPGDQQLWSVTIYADGRRVVVWDGTAHWQPDSGQFLFDFEPRAMAPQLPLLKGAGTALSPTPLTAEQWVDLASELEKHSPEEARRAYEQALVRDPDCVAAHINLGRLYHHTREFDRAEAYYRTALRHEPDDPIARYNLGVLLEDIKQPHAAIQAYLQAVARDPTLADAHYNLPLLYESEGKKTEAIRHFRAAHKLRGG